MHAYIISYIHACIHIYIHTLLHVLVCVYMLICLLIFFLNLHGPHDKLSLLTLQAAWSVPQQALTESPFQHVMLHTWSEPARPHVSPT